MIRKIILPVILVLSVLTVSAQHTLSGRITDKLNGEPLTGVNVYIPELSKGTVSDTLGNYSLTNLPNGRFIVQYSFVGFKTVNREINLSGKDITVNIKMETTVIQGEEVVISGNFTTTQHENTIKISTIGIDRIAASGNPSLIQSISKVPGVSMISKGPGVVTPVIRGLSLSNILVLNNGVPMENYQFSQDHPYLIDENGLKRVEIIKGPSSLIYGSGAVGGVINLIPEHPAAEGTVKGNADLRYFSNTVGFLANLGIKGNQKGFVWGVSGGVNSNKDFIQGNNEFAPNSRFNRYNLKADAGLIKELGVFRVFYSYDKSRFGLAVPPAFQLVTENGRNNEVWYQDLTDHLIISQNKFFLGKFKLDVNLSYEQNNRQLKGSETDPPFTKVDMTLKSFNYRIKAGSDLGKNGKIIFGIQGLWQKNTNGDAPNHILPDAISNDISGYVLTQWLVSNFKLEAGLRYSHITIDVPYQEAGSHNHGENGQEGDEHFIEYNNNFDDLSASAGATWNINEQNLLRLNLASAFRSPNLAELTQYGIHGTRFEIGNSDLKTQQNLEADLGYHLHTKHTSLDVSVFYNNIFGYIHLTPTADSTEDGYRIYRYIQSDARLYGGEVSLHVHPHPVDWLHIKATYSLVEGQYKNGEYLPLIPPQDLNLEIKFIAKKWKSLRKIYIEAGIDLVFAQNHPSVFETKGDPYNLLMMGAGFDIQLKRQTINFSITANNLLNVAYYNYLSTLKDVGIYDMGRNITFSIHIPFGIVNI